MGFGALRTIVRPLCRTLLSRASPASATTSNLFSSSCPKPGFNSFSGGSIYRQSPRISISSQLHSLTDTRFPKRRPQDKPRRKRASLKPPGTSTKHLLNLFFFPILSKFFFSGVLFHYLLLCSIEVYV